MTSTPRENPTAAQPTADTPAGTPPADPATSTSTSTTTLTADTIVAHIRFNEPGIDKSSALMLLYLVTGWLGTWNGRPVIDAHFQAWQHGPTDPAAHAAFPQVFPQRLRLPDDPMLELEVEAVITWALGGKPGQRGPVRSSALISSAKSTRAYEEAAAAGKPAFASGPDIEARLVADTFRKLAEAVAAGTADGPTQPGEEALAEAHRQAEAKRLRAQLAERFDTGPTLTEG